MIDLCIGDMQKIRVTRFKTCDQVNKQSFNDQDQNSVKPHVEWCTANDYHCIRKVKIVSPPCCFIESN